MPEQKPLDQLSRLWGKASVYTLFGAASQAIPFLLIPILTRYLDPGEYGQLAAFTAAIGVSRPLIDARVVPAVLHRYYDAGERSHFPQFVADALRLPAMLAVLAVAVLAVSAPGLRDWLGIGTTWILLVPAVVFAGVPSRLQLTIWRAEERATLYGIFSFALLAGEIGLSLGLVVVGGMGWEGRGFGILWSAAIFGVLAVFLMQRGTRLRLTTKPRYFRYLLAFGIPLIPQGLSVWALRGADRIMLMRLVGPEATGIYNVAYSIGAAVQFAATGLLLAWTPYLYSMLSGQTSNRSILASTLMGKAVVLILAVVVVAAAPLVFEVFVDPRYSQGLRLIAWITAGEMFHALYSFTTPFLIFYRKNSLLGMSVVLSAAINVALNAWLIPTLHDQGAAIATFVSYACAYALVLAVAIGVHRQRRRGTDNGGTIGE